MNVLKWIVGLIAVAMFAGCVQPVVINKTITDPHVIIENESIYDWLQFENVNYIQRDDGLIEVEAVFRNFTSNNKVLAYKIDWIDQNNFIQKSILSKWTIVKVEERRNLVIHGISPSMKVKDFRIRLQEPTDDDELRRDSYHYEYQGK